MRAIIPNVLHTDYRSDFLGFISAIRECYLVGRRFIGFATHAFIARELLRAYIAAVFFVFTI
jgi:hypothetical protein